MNPLKITASVIAVLQAENSLLSFCYDFRASLRKTPWSLSYVSEEIRNLRNILDSLEMLSERLEDRFDNVGEKIKIGHPLLNICDPDQGALASCLREVTFLESKILPWFSTSLAREGSKRRAFIQALGWQLKDRDASQSVERLRSHKLSLSLVLAADQV
jgi:hypothetical protein